MERQELDEQIAVATHLDEHFARRSLAYYLNSVVINSSPVPRRFGDIAEPWQRELVAPKIPAFEYLAGRNEGYAGPLMFMDILARGHDKSSLEARLISGLLVSSERRINGYILATDKDQGKLILQAAQDEARLNPWLNRHLVFKNLSISGPSGTVEVLPADAASAYGLRGNLFIADEFTHWKNDRLWRAVFSGTEKINPTVLVVLSNAGILDSWQHNVFTYALSSTAWNVFYREGQLASWMSAEAIKAKAHALPSFEARRLFDNAWIDGAAEADYLRREEVQACAALSSVLRLRLRLFPEANVRNYVAAVDYAPRRDRTALTVLHQDTESRVIVDRLDCWQGSPESPTSIDRVERWIRDINATFHPTLFVLDEYQMEGTIQRMEQDRIPVERFATRGGAGNFLMAQTLRALVVEGRLLWYPGAGALGEETFDSELIALRAVIKPYGYRFDHVNQRHDDRAVAVAMAAIRALEHPATPVTTPPSKVVLPESWAR